VFRGRRTPGDRARAIGKDVTNGSRVIQYFSIPAAWTGDKELALQQLELDCVLPLAL